MEIKDTKIGSILKVFRCKCREWVIRTVDSPKLPQDTSLLHKWHECPELTVYQEKEGLKRFYVRKVDLSAKQS